jgi:hypothetical protein
MKKGKLKSTPTKASVGKLLDGIEQEYNELFNDLILLKNFHSNRFDALVIFQFQYKLASGLYRLSVARNEIIMAERKLILRKDTLTKKWFVSRMKLFKSFKNAIDNVIVIGKSLGDAFVWHFYQLNFSEFFGSLDFPEIKLFPTGIGGIGELKFIKNHFIFNGHIVILHGISNFLRIGDISFFSLKDGKLSAVGEIKTKEIDKNKINVSITALNAYDRNLFDENLLKDVEITDTLDYDDYFDPERFKRQINKTSEFLKSKKREKEKVDKLIFDKYYFQEFAEAVNELEKKPLSLIHAGTDLVFAANKLSSKKFSQRFFIKQNASKLKKFESDIQKSILSILKAQGSNYPIQFGSVHIDQHFKIRIQIGAPPLFWYPIKPKILKQMYFFEIFVLTLFNPTNFFSELQEMGIELMKEENSNKLYFGKKTDEGIIRFEYFNYFFSLIENNLHTPEAVISLIKEMMLLIESKVDFHVGAKFQTEILHLFTHYNQDNIF